MNYQSEYDAHQLHYVKVPENHIVIDFDLKDSKHEKSLNKNLYYIYKGNIKSLA